MTNESHKPNPDTKVESPVAESSVGVPVSKKPGKVPWIIAGSILAVLCLCSILCVTMVGTGISKVVVERAPVEATLDTLMEYMEAKDVESAFALFSPRAQRQVKITDLEELTEGNNYKVFEGYESLSIQNLNLTAAANTNPDMPQGTVANVTAIVSYSDGFSGNLTAVLEKVDGEWKIFNFNVVVPPDKFSP